MREEKGRDLERNILHKQVLKKYPLDRHGDKTSEKLELDTR